MTKLKNFIKVLDNKKCNFEKDEDDYKGIKNKSIQKKLKMSMVIQNAHKEYNHFCLPNHPYSFYHKVH